MGGQDSGPRPVSALIRRLISGGQTGVDLIAMQWALDHGIAVVGLCPRGRRNEDGVIPPEFELLETASPHPASRTRGNVLISDATLIFTAPGLLSAGTELTARIAQECGRPLLVLNLPAPEHAADRLREFVKEHRVNALNVAGPRGSQWTAPEDLIRSLLSQALLVRARARRPRSAFAP